MSLVGAPLYPSEGYFAKETMKPKVQIILGYLERVTNEEILEKICRALGVVSGIRFVS